MTLNIKNITVEKSHEVSIANFDYIMSIIIMQVNIDASSLHDYWYIIFTDKSHACFEASSTAEGVHNIVDTQNHVSKDAIL